MKKDPLLLPLTRTEMQILHSLCFRAIYSSYANTHTFLHILRDERSEEIAALIQKLEDLDA